MEVKGGFMGAEEDGEGGRRGEVAMTLNELAPSLSYAPAGLGGYLQRELRVCRLRHRARRSVLGKIL